MEEQVGTAAEEKRSGGFGRFVLWAGVIVLLYVLSLGPVCLICNKRNFDSPLLIVYDPLELVYEDTPLHKPLGIYLHWWYPAGFDKNGEKAF